MNYRINWTLLGIVALLTGAISFLTSLFGLLEDKKLIYIVFFIGLPLIPAFFSYIFVSHSTITNINISDGFLLGGLTGVFSAIGYSIVSILSTIVSFFTGQNLGLISYIEHTQFFQNALKINIKEISSLVTYSGLWLIIIFAIFIIIGALVGLITATARLSD